MAGYPDGFKRDVVGSRSGMGMRGWLLSHLQWGTPGNMRLEKAKGVSQSESNVRKDKSAGRESSNQIVGAWARRASAARGPANLGIKAGQDDRRPARTGVPVHSILQPTAEGTLRPKIELVDFALPNISKKKDQQDIEQMLWKPRHPTQHRTATALFNRGKSSSVFLP